MNGETHSQLANLIWSICNLLRGPYKRNKYRKVNRHFYSYEPPRELVEIEAEIKVLEGEILNLFNEVTA